MKALTKETLEATLRATETVKSEYDTPVHKPRFEASSGKYAGSFHERRADIEAWHLATIDGKPAYLMPFTLAIFKRQLDSKPEVSFTFLYSTPANKLAKSQVGNKDEWKLDPRGLNNWDQMDTRPGSKFYAAAAVVKGNNEGEWIAVPVRALPQIIEEYPLCEIAITTKA